MILVCVAIYAVLIQSIATDGDPIVAIWGCVGYTCLLYTSRLHNEVVISNAPSRVDKHSKEQFLIDIERLFIEANRIVEDVYKRQPHVCG